ncbi:hypothetical protein MHYP_G00110670 [Metynnis hypsauchen]
MAKRFTIQSALQLILEETEGFHSDAEEEVSEYEDHISENSESDSEFEEKDQHQSAPKHKRASGPAHQHPGLCEKPATGPACQPAPKRKQTSGPAHQQQAPRPAGEQPAIEPDSQQLANDIWMSKNGKIEWSAQEMNPPAWLPMSKGEATESLWHEETGRELFQTYKIISRTIRFDDHDDRPARRQRDKLAAIRTVWDKWVARLPRFTILGPTSQLMSS